MRIPIIQTLHTQVGEVLAQELLLYEKLKKSKAIKETREQMKEQR